MYCLTLSFFPNINLRDPVFSEGTKNPIQWAGLILYRGMQSEILDLLTLITIGFHGHPLSAWKYGGALENGNFRTVHLHAIDN